MSSAKTPKTEGGRRQEGRKAFLQTLRQGWKDSCEKYF